ncbi:hypothetical protein ABBQ38_013295 [Trebouxia sp. C0009 RCD-2024]
MSAVDPKSLPVRGYADRIVEAVRSNSVTIVIGETGSGKTTQISQILEEAGFAKHGRIAVTQPRRVAAVSVARRVAQETDCELGQEVGYAVRFEERASARTCIKYLTDGTLLRELLDDSQLQQYSVIVLDEAHERSLNTDILFGVLKGLVKTRQKSLKLVITSATLDGQKFSTYFDDCPVFTVPGRTFEVQIVNSKENHVQDYLAAAVDTAMHIHLSEPAGDVLIFLTGQAEIDKAVRMLHEEVGALPEGTCGDMLVLPIYAALPPELQARVFAPGPPNCRRVIVATNIAETSITVEGVVYVIDPGLVKQKSHNPQTGMDSLEVVPISRVQAVQRAGRAGRTQPGKCYRLYTAKFFERDMPNVAVPEIQRTSLLTTVLSLKSLPLPVDVLAFDFLDAPKREALEGALKQLWVLDALDIDGGITPLGRQMVSLPLDPSLARALIAATQLGCLPQATTVAAMLSAESIFQGNRGPEQIVRGDQGGGRQGSKGRPMSGATDRGRSVLAGLMAEGLGDQVLLLRIFQAWQEHGFAFEWAKEAGLDVRGLRFARDVRRQLEGITGPNGSNLLGSHHEQKQGSGVKRKREDEDDDGPGNTTGLRQALLIGFANRLARRMTTHNGYKTLSEPSTLAQLHPSTARITADEDGLLPEWVIYHELISTAKVFLSRVCPVDDDWVAMILPKLRNVDVKRLSGGSTAAAAAAVATAHQDAPAADVVAVAVQSGIARKDQITVDAARARYMNRKAARTKK